MKEKVAPFISLSDRVEFLLFQDRLNGLYRYLATQYIAITDHVSQLIKNKEDSEEIIKNGPEYYGYGDMYFTKHEVLLGLDFEDGYEGGSGSDLSFFPQYFYSSVITLAVSLLESIVSEVIATVETEDGISYYESNSRKLKQPYLFKAIHFFNHNGRSYQIPTDLEKKYRKLNEIRNHYVHRLHEENFGRLTSERLLKHNLSYEYVLSAIEVVSLVAVILEKPFCDKKRITTR